VRKGEKKVTRCPYCKALCNPLRLALYNTKRIPYRCPKCNQKSVFKNRDAAFFGGIEGGIYGGLLVIIGINLIPERPYSFLLLALFLLLSIPFTLWFFMKLYPIETQEPKAEQKQ